MNHKKKKINNFTHRKEKGKTKMSKNFISNLEQPKRSKNISLFARESTARVEKHTTGYKIK